MKCWEVDCGCDRLMSENCGTSVFWQARFTGYLGVLCRREGIPHIRALFLLVINVMLLAFRLLLPDVWAYCLSYVVFEGVRFGVMPIICALCLSESGTVVGCSSGDNTVVGYVVFSLNRMPFCLRGFAATFCVLQC
jgi:hypothetical protein